MILAAPHGVHVPILRRAAGTRLSPLEAAAALGGGLALAAVLVALLRPGASEPEPIELTRPAAAAASSEAAYTAPSSPTPMPVAAPSVPATALVLHGVLGGGRDAAAVIARPDGSQALVRIGREVVPGVVLKAVERNAVLLAERRQVVRLALLDSGGGGRLQPIDPASRAQEETLAFKLALGARRDGDAITGFAIGAGQAVPLFERAGLKPGDVVTGVNGRALASEEEVDKLAQEVALSPTMVFTVERDGKSREFRVETRQ